MIAYHDGVIDMVLPDVRLVSCLDNLQEVFYLDQFYFTRENNLLSNCLKFKTMSINPFNNTVCEEAESK